MIWTTQWPGCLATVVDNPTWSASETTIAANWNCSIHRKNIGYIFKLPSLSIANTLLPFQRYPLMVWHFDSLSNWYEGCYWINHRPSKVEMITWCNGTDDDDTNLGHFFLLRHCTRRVYDALGWITLMDIWRVKRKMDKTGYWSSLFNIRFSIDDGRGCGLWTSGAECWSGLILSRMVTRRHSSQDHWRPGAEWKM